MNEGRGEMSDTNIEKRLLRMAERITLLESKVSAIQRENLNLQRENRIRFREIQCPAISESRKVTKRGRDVSGETEACWEVSRTVRLDRDDRRESQNLSGMDTSSVMNVTGGMWPYP